MCPDDPARGANLVVSPRYSNLKADMPCPELQGLDSVPVIVVVDDVHPHCKIVVQVVHWRGWTVVRRKIHAI